MTEFAPQLKLLHHPEALTGFLRGNAHAAPVQVEISPTNSCPAKCPWCWFIASDYKQKHSAEELPPDALFSALRDMADMGVRAVSWTGGGDPCVYSAMDDAIDLASTWGLKQGMFTNAYRPIRCPEKLAWIRVTLTERFALTKHVSEYAKRTKVGVNFNLCEENQVHLERMCRLARDAGVAYFQVRPALADRWDLQKPVACPKYLKHFETETFRVVLTDYKWDDYLRPHGYAVCHGHRMVPYLWHNGDLAVCAYHFGKEAFNFGNVIREGGFRAVWLGDRRRQMLADGVAVVPECQHACKLNQINVQLAAMRDVTDVEFL